MSLRTITHAAALPALLLIASSASAMPMNGTFTVHYDKQSPQPIAPDRVKIDESGSGINKSPGQPFDDAQVLISETVTLVKGQGPVNGTIIFTTPNGSTTSSFTGKVMTDAQGRLTAVGKSRVVKATGAFAGSKGSGTFSTAFSSPTDQTTTWQGNFIPPKTKPASR